MPSHSVLAGITLATAGVAALAALAYAWLRGIRGVTRWPLLVISVTAIALIAVTGEAGSDLMRSVEASASAAEIAAAQAHGKTSDAFALSVFGLLVTVLATIWKALRPHRQRWGPGMWAGAILLSAFAIATLVSGGLVLDAALDASALRTTG